MSKIENLRQLLYKAIGTGEADEIMYISRKLDKEILRKIKGDKTVEIK